MFFCDQCQYTAGNKGKIHHNNLHQDIKYTCDTCGHQTSSKGSFRKQQQAINKGKKLPSGDRDNQATLKSLLFQHIQAIHMGKRYPCTLCTYQATYKSDLNIHQKRVHKPTSMITDIMLPIVLCNIVESEQRKA